VEQESTLVEKAKQVREDVEKDSIHVTALCGLGIARVTNVFYSFTDVSIVVSAPTGSGKTVIFELAIIRLLTKLEAMEYAGEYKIVYSK
jgi:replicative superfamily II helicase